MPTKRSRNSAGRRIDGPDNAAFPFARSRQRRRYAPRNGSPKKSGSHDRSATSVPTHPSGSMDLHLEGRIALVTGGGGAIGAAIAARFIAEGAVVYVADIDAQSARATAERFGA